MTRRENYPIHRGMRHKFVACDPLGKSLRPYCLQDFPSYCRSGQFICYKTGQNYLLPTARCDLCRQNATGELYLKSGKGLLQYRYMISLSYRRLRYLPKIFFSSYAKRLRYEKSWTEYSVDNCAVMSPHILYHCSDYRQKSAEPHSQYQHALHELSAI